MGETPKRPMPKKWIILVTVIIVACIVVALLTSYKPPSLQASVKSIQWTGTAQDRLNLTLTYTTKDVNVTSDQYSVRVDVWRTIDSTQDKKTALTRPLPNINPQSSVDQALTLDGVKGYTDLNIYVLKGSKTVVFLTQRIPVA